MYIKEEIWKEYLSNNEELFKIVGASFINDYANYHKEILENIDSNNIDTLHNMLHSLKGITLNLGMKDLYDQTENTLIPIRKDIIDKEEFNKLLDIFDKSYEELNKLL